MENNILSIYREKLVFEYDISELQDKIDEIFVVSRLMGYIHGGFFRPSRGDYFVYGVLGNYKGFTLSFVVERNVVVRVGVAIGNDEGSYYENGELFDELDKLLVYI